MQEWTCKKYIETGGEGQGAGGGFVQKEKSLSEII